MPERVTLVGAGLMGRALGLAWLQASVEVAVWNRTAENCLPLVASGAGLASSLAEAVSFSDVTVLVVADTEVAIRVLRDQGPPEGLAGKTVLNLSTGTPDSAKRLADLVVELGGSPLEGVISGYPSDIGTSRAMIQCSGPNEGWAATEGLLTLLAPSATTLVGSDIGMASVVDVIQTGYVYTNAISGFLEGAALAKAHGLTVTSLLPGVDLMIDLLRTSVREAAAQIDNSDFSTADATVDIYLAAIRLWRETARESGVWTSHMDAIVTHLERAQQSGLGPQGFFSEVESMARLSI